MDGVLLLVDGSAGNRCWRASSWTVRGFEGSRVRGFNACQIRFVSRLVASAGCPYFLGVLDKWGSAVDDVTVPVRSLPLTTHEGLRELFILMPRLSLGRSANETQSRPCAEPFVAVTSHPTRVSPDFPGLGGRWDHAVPVRSAQKQTSPRMDHRSPGPSLRDAKCHVCNWPRYYSSIQFLLWGLSDTRKSGPRRDGKDGSAHN